MGRVEGNRNFCNKLWNAASYVFSRVDTPLPDEPVEYTVADRWIRSRLRSVIERFQRAFAEYRFDLATQALYEFTWHEYCDWYLEMTKTVLNDAEAPQTRVRAAQRCLTDVLDAQLRLLHPIIPFVTEELWLELCRRSGRESATIMLEAQPRPESYEVDAEAEAEIDWLKAFVMGVRQVRGEMSIPPGKRLPVRLAGATDLDRERIDRHQALLTSLARLDDIGFVESADAVSDAATALVDRMTILVPLEGLIDMAAERARLGKQIRRASDERERSRKKLANPQFVANAPAAVVDRERQRAAALEERIAQLNERLSRLSP